MNPLDPIISEFVAGVLVNLSERIAQSAGRAVRAAMQGPEQRAALGRCVTAGWLVLAWENQKRLPERARYEHTMDIWQRFFEDEEVGLHLAPLVEGRPARAEELASIFDESFDRATLPGLPFEEALRYFEAAFIERALWEPTLQPVVQAGQLLTQSQIQRELLAEVRAILQALAARGAAPGISAGDVTMGPGSHLVIGTVINPPPPDPGERLKRAYLTALFTSLRQMALSGLDPATTDPKAHLHLDAVYTALLTERGEEVERRSGEGLAPRRPLSALARLEREARLVLVGDPGGGKSTFVSFVALCMAGEALGEPSANLSHLTAPLPKDPSQSHLRSAAKDDEEPQPWSYGALLPFRVVLREFAARGLPPAGAPVRANCLWDFIAEGIKELGCEEAAPRLCQVCQEEPTLLLLDGLDEVPEANQRREQLREAVLAFIRAFPRCRVLVTSRPYAYQQAEWKLPGFAEGRLLPFHQGQVWRFVERWYAHYAALRGLRAEEGAARAALLREAIKRNPRLGELAARPLLLTLMASLHAWRGGSLPEKREELYHDAVELLLYQWEQQRVVYDARGEREVLPSLQAWLKVERGEIRRLLEQLAYEVHAAGGLEGTADIPAATLSHRLLALGRARGVNPTELLDHLEQRTGLLVARGAETYSFPHRTFQEYLAACWLTNQNPAHTARLVGEEPNRWREAALLAAARAQRGGDWQGWTWVQALCPTRPAGQEQDEAKAWRALLAGQVITESLNTEQVPEEYAPMRERVRDWQLAILQGTALPARERALAGNTLAVLGDPRFDPDHWDLPHEPLHGFVEIPAGPFLMGSDPKRDPDARADEQLQHELTLPTYWLARYPVTVAQWRAFVEASGFKPSHRDSLRGIANHPVVRVTWHEALAYCVWLIERLREVAPVRLAAGGLDESQRRFWEGLASGQGSITLPSEAEWEKGARGTDGSIYPWGDEWDAERANTYEAQIGSTSAVGAFAGGGGSYGLLDMSGNVYEWTCSDYAAYPYPSGGIELEQRESLTSEESAARVLRGASWDLVGASDARGASRHFGRPRSGNGYLGFRLACPSAPIPFPDRGVADR